MDTMFLNVDLDIESEAPLDRIVDAIGDRAAVLFHDRVEQHYRASFEVGDDIMTSGVDHTIRKLCDLVEGLPPQARAVWDACYRRVLDIGIQSGPEPQRFLATVNADTVRRAADAGCAFTVTVYGGKFGLEEADGHT